jgi:hypothetical protein
MSRLLGQVLSLDVNNRMFYYKESDINPNIATKITTQIYLYTDEMDFRNSWIADLYSGKETP